jgi:chemotaxis protein MotB
MLKRIVFLVLGGLTVLSLSGCLVAESTYLKKVEEADNLTREYADLKLKHEKLTAENTALKAEVATQLKGKQELEQLLKAKSDTLSQNVSDLREKVAALEAENKELLKAREKKVKEVSNIYEKLLQDMKSEISQGQVTISELKGKLTVTMETAILFDSGKADIKPDGLTILRKMVATLKGVRDEAIRIEGHTDNITIAGALTSVFPTNWELSAARAINVARYLQRQGLDPAALSAATFSEFKPVADNGTREGRAKNRRIEITLVAKD